MLDTYTTHHEAAVRHIHHASWSSC